MKRSFTEADVLGWAVAGAHGGTDVVDSLSDAQHFAEEWDRHYPKFAPHRVCAVVPWTQEEDNDG